MKGMLTPSHPHGQKIAEIFSYAWKWIETSNEGTSPDWKTNTKHPIRPRVLWAKHQDAGTIVGVRFGKSTRYCMIDIDKGSPHNSPEGIKAITYALETIGITRTIIIRSSWSGGHHIYCPLPQAVPTFGLAVALEQNFLAHGLAVSPGTLETFPNVKTYGKWWEGQYSEYNGHRLPLQPATGSCLVDGFDLEPIHQAESLAIFFGLWSNAEQHQDIEMILEAISVGKALRRRRQSMAKSKVAEWKADLESVIAEGWTGPHQTNQMLKEIACYGVVFEGLQGQPLVDYIERTATNCPGFFEWSDHQHDLHRRATSWALCASHYYWPLGTLPLINRTNLSVNDYRAAEARERITEALKQIGETIGLTIRQLATKLAEMARCSMATLYRNRDLWHPYPTPEGTPEDGMGQTPVTDDISRVPTSLAEIQAAVRASLESVGITPVTGQGGGNEVCSLKSLLQKNLHSGGKEGGAGGEKGFPQAKTPPQPVENSSGNGWLPRMDWRQGAVADV